MRRAPALKPIHPEIIPPPGAKPAGVSPSGKQLYEIEEVRAEIVDKVNPETGEVEHRKNTITGEQLHKLREVKRDEEGNPVRSRTRKLFYLESEGNGNIRKVPYEPPSEEEMQEAERRQQIESMQEGLAAALVDAGLTPEEAIRRLRGGSDAGDGGDGEGETPGITLDPPEIEPVEPEDAPSHPVWDIGVRDLPDVLADLDDPEILANYLAAEEANPGHEGGRSTALKAIRERLEDVEGGEAFIAEADARSKARSDADATPEI